VRIPYVLTVSGWGDPRKDLTTTLRAFAALGPARRAAHQLVVACDLPPEGRVAWQAEARAAGLTDDEVVFTGRVEDAALRTLYEQCAVFVLASRYEGFGLPALEAAARGAAVITTDSSSLPEVLELPASTVPVGDVAALARALERALGDPAFAAELRAAGARAAARHTWTAVAARTVDAWAAAPSIAPRQLPMRLAIAGPFPPSKSGVATFDARLVAALARVDEVAVDCFRESDDPFPSPPAGRGWRELPVQALDRTQQPGSYDAVVYVLGNGHAHRVTLDRARRGGGIVWLHDARLAGLYLTAAGLFVPGREPGPAEIAAARATMHTAVARVYGPEARQPGDDEWWRTEWYDAHGYTFLEEVVASADEIIVNTSAARAAIERAARGRTVPVHVLPHPFPDLGVAGRPPDATEPLVVTLGWVDPVKRPNDLIRAIARVRRTLPCRLAFVGEVAPDLRAALAALARDERVDAAVEFTGFTDVKAYASWLARAELVVQLRAATHGEASGALCDAIAAGRPVLTSIGTASDLPSGVVAIIDADASVDDLAIAILGLLSEGERSGDLARAAREHAATWRYGDLARAVASIVRAHAAAGAPPLPAGHSG
jgi:glycosyltransferase involved in cell wall biosynthesis